MTIVERTSSAPVKFSIQPEHLHEEYRGIREIKNKKVGSLAGCVFICSRIKKGERQRVKNVTLKL
jgi:hypothetical protein